jgi:hypothetical protein
MLRQYIKPTGARWVAIQFTRCRRFHRGNTFNDFKAIGRHQYGMGWFIHAVIGTPNPLQQPRNTLGRANLNHLIHIAPINAKIE